MSRAHRGRTRTFLLVVLAAAVGLAAAPWPAVPGERSLLVAQAPAQVNLRFSWKLKGEYAHLYVAEANGHFRDAGLSVRLGEGAGSQAALGALIQGQEDLVLLPGTFALTAISRGMPVKLIALYHPRTPMALISWPDNPVRTPKDLEGKTVASAVGETATSYLGVLCAKNNVDCKKIKLVQMAIQARVPQFLARQVDVVSVYQTNDLPILEHKEGKKFVVLDLPQHGLNVPGMALVSSDAVIARRADVLRKFLRATALGIADTRRNPEEAARIMLRTWQANLPVPVVTAQVQATVEAIPVVAGRPVGWIEESVIADALQLLKGAGEIETVRPVKDYYTNALLEGGSS